MTVTTDRLQIEIDVLESLTKDYNIKLNKATDIKRRQLYRDLSTTATTKLKQAKAKLLAQKK